MVHPLLTGLTFILTQSYEKQKLSETGFLIFHEFYEILWRKRLGEKVSLLIIASKLLHFIFHIYSLYSLNYDLHIRMPEQIDEVR